MTLKKYEWKASQYSCQNWTDAEDYGSNAVTEDDIPLLSINPPPEDGRCDFCRRHVSEVETFGDPGDKLGDLFFGAKLAKNFRQCYPYHVVATWECRDCFIRPEPLWWIDAEEKRLGRRLTDTELAELQIEFELEAKRFDTGEGRAETELKLRRTQEVHETAKIVQCALAEIRYPKGNHSRTVSSEAAIPGIGNYVPTDDL